jgi:hypothetical protein
MPLFRPVPTQSARALAVALAIPVTGCGAELDVWTGTHIGYLSSPSLSACTGTHRYVDDFVPFVSGELGLEPPSGLEYQWLDENDFESAPCRESISGCSRKDTAYARGPSLLHEIVHTVTWTAGMNNHLFFTEGLAVAYDPWLGEGVGPRYTLAVGPGDPLPDPRLALDAGTDDLDYTLAGSFVTFLLTRHGPENFISFSQRIRNGDKLASIQSSFQAVYGLDFDTEVDLFRFGTPCADNSFSVRVYDCAAPEVTWEDDMWSFTAGMNCADEGVVGGLGTGPATPSIRSVTFNVPATGQYTLSVEGNEGVVVQTGPCFGCPWIPGEVGVSAGGEVTAEFAAGPHYLRIRAHTDDSLDVRAVLRPVP